MKNLIILITFIVTSSTHAMGILEPVNLNQSSSGLNWLETENNAVRVIYPDYMGTTAKMTANLIEHYSQVVGISYFNLPPKKFSLIMRPEVAELNGFVTLAPRRSEWFTSATISPVIGALNFYQALAIHEYRHIVQFDYMLRSTNKLAYSLFGDLGLQLAIFLGLPAWYFEGDAVWAETEYTDAGRGRSPRFGARLKALVLNDQVPSYDEFLGRTYNTNHPNHYVIGYYLITSARKRFGEDIWAKIVKSITKFSFNPYAITNAFHDYTQIRLEDFYNQTMTELKAKWLHPGFKKASGEYQNIAYPLVDKDKLYYLKRTLDSHWGLYQYGKNKPEIEVPVSPALSKIDLKNNLLVYTQYLPSPRYGYKSYSDLFTYDLETRERKHLIEDSRIFHPAFSPDGSRISFTNQNELGQWSIKIVDLNGKEIDQLQYKNELITEAVWKSDTKLLAIVQRNDGYKKLVEIDLSTKRSKTLMGFTRNNLFSLSVDGPNLVFEADYKGAVQIFSLNTDNLGLKRCTDEVIAAYNPTIKKNKLYYVSEVANGKDVKVSNTTCASVSNNALVDFNYLGDTPSDNYQKAKLVKINDFDSLINKELPSQEHSEFTDKLTPHSWSFVSGRGIELSMASNNYLNSFGYDIGVGRSSEEKQPFGYLEINYTKHYPVFSLKFEYEKREDNDTIIGRKDIWEELEATAKMTLPYSFKKGFYNNYFALSGSYGVLKYTRNDLARVYEISDQRLDVTGAEIVISSLKDKTERDLIPSYGLQYIGAYQDAKAKEFKSFSSDVLYQDLSFYLPGLTVNSGLKLNGTTEQQKKGSRNYRFDPLNDDFTSYVFSRGFDYFYVDKYQKASLDYYFPMSYPDMNLAGWFYLRRIYAKLFFDHTKAEISTRTYNFNSTGAELNFESYVLRKLDLSFGMRASHRIDYTRGDKEIYDFFLGINL